MTDAYHSCLAIHQRMEGVTYIYVSIRWNGRVMWMWPDGSVFTIGGDFLFDVTKNRNAAPEWARVGSTRP